MYRDRPFFLHNIFCYVLINDCAMSITMPVPKGAGLSNWQALSLQFSVGSLQFAAGSCLVHANCKPATAN